MTIEVCVYMLWLGHNVLPWARRGSNQTPPPLINNRLATDLSGSVVSSSTVHSLIMFRCLWQFFELLIICCANDSSDGFRHVRPNRDPHKRGAPSGQKRSAVTLITTMASVCLAVAQLTQMLGHLSSNWVLVELDAMLDLCNSFPIQKPFLKLGNNSKTVCTCSANAEFVASFSTLMWIN